MYTSVVGKTFLIEYNRRNGTDYSAKEFFDKEIFEQVFNHKRYLLWPGNSPFVQGLSKKIKPFFDEAERLEKLEKVHSKIAEGARDASIAIGFPASDSKEFAKTSGLVTDLSIKIDNEDVYLSWIGGALSIGVGAYSILFDDPEITYTTFEGWQYYRRFLNDPLFSKLPPNKLTTWNGQWLSYRYDELYDEKFNFNTLLQEGVFTVDENEIKINVISWSKLYFNIASFLETDSTIAYIGSFDGQENKTVGFIPFQFQSGRNLIATYQKLFGTEEYRLKKTSEFEAFFGRHIKRACEMGSIGLHALRPESLKNYFGDSKNLQFYSAKADRKKDESEEVFRERLEKESAKSKATIISYQTYKTWLVAMLSKNKTDISDYSRDIAQALVRYRAGGRKLDRKNLLENEFFQTNKIKMLEALNKIVTSDEVEQEIKDQMNSLRDQVHFMSREDFSYFITLLKFDYSYAEFKNQQP